MGRETLPGGGDWYAEVAPAEYQALYEAVRLAARGAAPTPATAPRPRGRLRRPAAGSAPRTARWRCRGSAPMRRGRPRPDAGATARAARAAPRSAAARRRPHPPQRDALGRWLRPGWTPGAKDLYATLSDAVARASARRWEAAMDAGAGAGEAMLWRLLRIGSAPYFVLGSSAARSLRLRIATSWDWRQQFQLRRPRHGAPGRAVSPGSAGRPRCATGVSYELHVVVGHIEVRWSHGRFGGLPEAKGYLDTPHHLVPGYCHPAMSVFDPAAFTPPLRVPDLASPAGRAAALRGLRPRHGAPGVRRPAHPLHLVGAAGPTRTTPGGPSSSASTPRRRG